MAASPKSKRSSQPVQAFPAPFLKYITAATNFPSSPAGRRIPLPQKRWDEKRGGASASSFLTTVLRQLRLFYDTFLHKKSRIEKQKMAF